MVCANKTVVSIFKVWFEGYYGFLAHFLYRFLEVADVLTFLNQILQNTRVKLLGRFVVILKLLTWSLESL